MYIPYIYIYGIQYVYVYIVYIVCPDADDWTLLSYFCFMRKDTSNMWHALAVRVPCCGAHTQYVSVNCTILNQVTMYCFTLLLLCHIWLCCNDVLLHFFKSCITSCEQNIMYYILRHNSTWYCISILYYLIWYCIVLCTVFDLLSYVTLWHLTILSRQRQEPMHPWLPRGSF